MEAEDELFLPKPVNIKAQGVREDPICLRLYCKMSLTEGTEISPGFKRDKAKCVRVAYGWNLPIFLFVILVSCAAMAVKNGP